MLDYTGQARREAFSFFVCQSWGHLHLASTIIETSVGQGWSMRFNIYLYDITSGLCLTLFSPLSLSVAQQRQMEGV